MGRMQRPGEFQQPIVKVTTKTLPDTSAVVDTTGSWIPKDSFLVDQLALMSIATKQRLRELIGEADRVAKNRQTTSNGEVPEEWAEAAAPLAGVEQADTSGRTGAESAVSPRTNPLKRRLTRLKPSATLNSLIL
jgi:hypothetical protein